MSKKNYKMIISYDGSRYKGWEHQRDQETIQGKIENVLGRLAGGDEQVEILGAGRTDAGVHAEGMCASFFLDSQLTAEQIRDYLNRYLPDDIAVREVREASDRFHARYNATGKTYRYTIYNGPVKPVFDRRYVWTVEERLDIARMKGAASVLQGKHDFASFCRLAGKNKSTVRNVDDITIRQSGERIILLFHGDGFLRNMVRIMTGTIVAAGKGEIDEERIREILSARDRTIAPATAPAQGLCLVSVDYD